jgi:hypothetical protein
MNCFFFKHGLTTYRKVPGRYRYDVTGTAMVRKNEHFLRKSFSGPIYGDALGKNRPSSNIDPNVLSDVLPWFLSFCLIDGCNAKRKINGKGQTLAKTVRAGDVIVFGGLLSTHLLFVDTVLCVARTAHIPQSGKRLSVDGYYRKNARTLGLGTWQSFISSRSYRLNLIDAEQGGGHERTKVEPHLQIIGRRGPLGDTVEPDVIARNLLRGDGVNFIPLAFGSEPLSRNRGVRRSPGLLTVRFTGAARVLCHSINKLAPSNSETLLHSIVSAADTLVLDPVEPVYPVKRRGGGC